MSVTNRERDVSGVASHHLLVLAPSSRTAVRKNRSHRNCRGRLYLGERPRQETHALHLIHLVAGA
jgi:hypothetical protein